MRCPAAVRPFVFELTLTAASLFSLLVLVSFLILYASQIFVNVPNGDYVRLEVTTLDKIEHIKRQLFLMNKTWDMSRQRIMFNTWGQQQKCSRWGAAVLSTQPTVVRRPLPAEERLTVIGVGPECVLDMQLVDPL